MKGRSQTWTSIAQLHVQARQFISYTSKIYVSHIKITRQWKDTTPTLTLTPKQHSFLKKRSLCNESTLTRSMGMLQVTQAHCVCGFHDMDKYREQMGWSLGLEIC